MASRCGCGVNLPKTCFMDRDRNSSTLCASHGIYFFSFFFSLFKYYDNTVYIVSIKVLCEIKTGTLKKEIKTGVTVKKKMSVRLLWTKRYI